MATIGQLTASIAHEVNNPLGGVMLCFNNLIKGSLDEKDRNLHIEVINSGLSRIRKIMGDLLDYSRQSCLSMQPTRVADVVHKSISLLELFARKKQVRLDAVIPDDNPLILMDSTKIQQVLVNLLVNAIHATPEGGRVTITCHLDENYFTFIVKDTGTGIDEAIQQHIFDPFFSSKGEQGTGLGLTLSRSLVEQHGGRLELVKSSNRGSVFAIHIPRTGKDA
jgi:signal transduction histidine kinase